MRVLLSGVNSHSLSSRCPGGGSGVSVGSNSVTGAVACDVSDVAGACCVVSKRLNDAAADGCKTVGASAEVGG